jgi:hypothetical protein
MRNFKWKINSMYVTLSSMLSCFSRDTSRRSLKSASPCVGVVCPDTTDSTASTHKENTNRLHIHSADIGAYTQLGQMWHFKRTRQLRRSEMKTSWRCYKMCSMEFCIPRVWMSFHVTSAKM